MSAGAYVRAIAEHRAKNWVDLQNVDWEAIEIKTSSYDGSAYLDNVPNVQNGNEWLDHELRRLAYSYDLTKEDPKPEPAKPAPYCPNLCW